MMAKPELASYWTEESNNSLEVQKEILDFCELAIIYRYIH